jgi:large subunit ribosomal protein L25
VTCLPKDLPEFIEIDIADLGLGETIHMSDLKLTEGVELVELAHGNDAAIVNVHHTRTGVSEDEEKGEEDDKEDDHEDTED